MIVDSYSDFAEVYDIFMDDTPYREWCDFLIGAIGRYGVSKPTKGKKAKKDIRETKSEELLTSERNLVADLGCGTGTLTELMAEAGYDMIGIDNSERMLEIAMEKREISGQEILYLCQDMQELELYSTVGTVISVCDSLNYLLEEEEMLHTFRLVNNYLYPGGLFLFDFNTVYKYSTLIGETTIAENREDCSFIWENYYDDKESVNEYDLTIFVKEGELYRKFEETHYQRGYTETQMRHFIEKAGMEWVTSSDADTGREVTPESGRIHVIARECRKER